MLKVPAEQGGFSTQQARRVHHVERAVTMSVSLLLTTLPFLLSVLTCSEELEIVNCVSLVSAAVNVVNLEIS